PAEEEGARDLQLGSDQLIRLRDRRDPAQPADRRGGIARILDRDLDRHRGDPRHRLDLVPPGLLRLSIPPWRIARAALSPAAAAPCPSGRGRVSRCRRAPSQCRLAMRPASWSLLPYSSSCAPLPAARLR